MRLLLVEDDRGLAGEICRFLRRWGYETVQAHHFDDICGDFRDSGAHLVLMDVNLPYYDGFYWCGRIRRTSAVPVIFISSRTDDRDKIMAVAQGGDDYVEKPFRLELLKAKIEAVLRRAYQYRVRMREYLGSDLCFEPASDTLFCGDRAVELTRSERRIMSRLVERRPEPVSREELMMALWSTDEYISDGTLTVLICRLRSKLREACGDEIIRTRKGTGYCIE